MDLLSLCNSMYRQQHVVAKNRNLEHEHRKQILTFVWDMLQKKTFLQVKFVAVPFFHQPSWEGATAEQKLQTSQALPFSIPNWTKQSSANSNCRTATAIRCTTPGDDGSIFQNRSKGRTHGLNLLHSPCCYYIMIQMA